MSFQKKLCKLLSACLVVVLCLLLCWIVPAGSGNRNVLWIWSGAVTTDSVVIKAKLLLDVPEALIQVYPRENSGEGSGAVVEIQSKADSDSIVTFRIAGLQSNTDYGYRIEAGGVPGPEGRFHTFADGPMSFRICFASCATTGSNHRIFSTLKDLHPLFFVHMGDFHYEDIRRNDPSLFRQAFDRVLTSPRQASFYRSTPIAYVWDDHDFGPDDADGTSPSKAAARQAYQQTVPHYPLSRVDGHVQTIQQAFTVGRVRFLFLDVRSERSPITEPDGPNKSMLGKEQLEWLHLELQEAAQLYPLVILINNVPWITKNTPGSSDGWEQYNYERTVIADMIKEAGLVDRLIMLSGDAHMVAIDDGTNSNYAGDREAGENAFPVIQAAPLDRYAKIKGGPYSHGISAPYRWLKVVKAKQFGLMDLEDDGNQIQIQLSGRNADGKILKNLELKVVCSQNGCKVS